MVEVAKRYTDYVRDVAGADGTILVEQRVDCSTDLGVDEAFGTADALIIRGDEMIVVDLKTGRGVEVEADSAQLKAYALGCLPIADQVAAHRAGVRRLVQLGVPSPLAGRAPGDIDFFVVRENTEGEYSSIGGRMFASTDREVVIQETVMTRVGVDRVLRYAFDLAQRRPRRKLTSATKSNGISITMPYWDERVEEMAKNYSDVTWDKFHIDILTAHFVLHPDWFDVVVASNLFGDILSDLGPACTGTIGIAPSGNINPEGKFPSLFEPVHGSAPDIAGQGVANPIGQIWSGAMMLDHLGEREAAAEIVAAVERTLAERTLRTRDLGGNAGTEACGKAVEAQL
jgi:tartrate dehydrogenase/decarboxylase/D-malate dehydrogenase